MKPKRLLIGLFWVLAAACQPLQPVQPVAKAVTAAAPVQLAPSLTPGPAAVFMTPQQFPSSSPVPTLANATPTKAATSLPAALGTIALPGEQVAVLSLSDQAVYWVTSSDPRNLHRAAIQGGQAGPAEVAATSKYINGALSGLTPVIQGNWLVFLDRGFNVSNPLWQLRALNLTSGHEKTLAQAGKSYNALLYSFSSDGVQAAWTLQDQDPKRSCPDESALVVANLETGVSRELDRSCQSSSSGSAVSKQWIEVQISGKWLLADALLGGAGGTSQVNLFNLTDGSSHALNTDPSQAHASSPALSAEWAAWQAGLGETVLVHISDAHVQKISTPAGLNPMIGPRISGNWLFWQPGDQKITVYDLKAQSMRLAAGAAEDETPDKPQSNTIYAEAISGDVIAWCRSLDSGAGSVIEWGRLGD